MAPANLLFDQRVILPTSRNRSLLVETLMPAQDILNKKRERLLVIVNGGAANRQNLILLKNKGIGYLANTG